MSAPDGGRGARRRAAGVLAVALVVSAGCVVAGLWQWGRHQDRSAEVALVEANYDAVPVPLDELLADGLADDDVWRPATVTGRYVGGAVLRNRPVSGTPAVHALGVLEVTDGPLVDRVLVVDRGWLPAAATPLDPPRGTVSLVVRLRAAEPSADRAAPPGQVRRIAPAQVLAAAGLRGDPLGAYGAAAEEDGAPPADVEVLPRPVADLGPHLSYAFQWWVFAAGALVGAVVLLRRDASEDVADPLGVAPVPAAGEPGARATGRRRGRPTRRRAPSAEDEEDALLDAAERAAQRTAADGPAAASPTGGPVDDPSPAVQPGGVSRPS